VNGLVKKVVVGLLAGGAIAIWAPKIKSMMDDSPSASRPERGPDDEFAGESSVEEYAVDSSRHEESGAVSANVDTTEVDTNIGEPAPGPSTPNGNGLDDLASVLEALRTFVPKQRPIDLDRAASAVAMMGAQSATPTARETQNTALTSEPTFTIESTSNEEPGESAVDMAERFLSENALTGILYDGESSVALLGGRVVKIGDELASGSLVVTAITVNRVSMQALSGNDSETYYMDLPPFRPARVSSSQGESAVSESEEETTSATEDSE